MTPLDCFTHKKFNSKMTSSPFVPFTAVPGPEYLGMTDTETCLTGEQKSIIFCIKLLDW